MMPKRKGPLPAPIHDWIDKKMSIGEIVLDIARDYFEELKELIQAPKTNQLAAQVDLQKRKKQFIAQVNAAFSEMNAYQKRQANAGAVNKRINGVPTAAKVEEIFNDLKAKGARVTAPVVESEWRKRFDHDRSYGQPVTPQAIRKHLKKLETKAT